MKVPVETPKCLKQLASVNTTTNACVCMCVHVYTYVCMYVCIYVQLYVQYVCVDVCMCIYICVCVCACVYAGDSVRSWSPPSSATNPMYANVNSDGGITTMENPPITCNDEEPSLCYTDGWYQNDGEPSLRFTCVYVQSYPTLTTRPRTISPLDIVSCWMIIS